MDLWEKLRRDSARIFPQIHISVVLMAKFPIEAPQSDGAFFLIRVGSVGKKVFFWWGEDPGKVSAKSSGAKGLCPLHGKHFT
ncbi:hypothetical protein ACLB9Y_04680 [Chryseobacterium scophthalmum]|uniref:hypothetical protein n=1 Tax=Chryseobacterium scophthalmum TaxID=59733 RepID=UPI00398B0E03